jgi:hypothetical protein
MVDRKDARPPEERSEDGHVLNEAAERRGAQQRIAAEVLGHGGSYREAGERAGVDARTIQRWMRDPLLRARVSEQWDAWVDEVRGQLEAAGPEAVTVLRAECRDAPRSADRVRAATALLSYSQRFRREHEFEARLQTLEERLGIVAPTVDDAGGGPGADEGDR